MNTLYKLIAGAFALAITSTSIAASNTDFSKCTNFFANGKQPVVSNHELQPRALCYNEFAILHSGKTKTPIFVAERLSKSHVEVELPRSDKFFADARLPKAERAEVDDYKGSGFDRGHMAPAADMYSPEGMAQSFSLANMVPQYPNNNRKSWASIEKSVRKYISRADGDVFVITGPIFSGNAQMIGNSKVWIPSHLFKLVYDPSTGKKWAHWHQNTDDAKVMPPISYEELVQRTGIQFF